VVAQRAKALVIRSSLQWWAYSEGWRARLAGTPV